MLESYASEHQPQNSYTLSAGLNSNEFKDAFDLNYPPVDQKRIERAITDLLEAAGEDVRREGLRNTPSRVARMYQELLIGYRIDPEKLINHALFDADYDEMVVVHHIEFSSLCEHHLLPFTGFVHVAYIPQGTVVGLSTIPRIVDAFSRRLQIQERMTQQIARFLNEVLKPSGVAVVVEGKHLCSMMRGVKKQHSEMVTSAMLGKFSNDERARHEVMMCIK